MPSEQFEKKFGTKFVYWSCREKRRRNVYVLIFFQNPRAAFNTVIIFLSLYFNIRPAVTDSYSF